MALSVWGMSNRDDYLAAVAVRVFADLEYQLALLAVKYNSKFKAKVEEIAETLPDLFVMKKVGAKPKRVQKPKAEGDAPKTPRKRKRAEEFDETKVKIEKNPNQVNVVEEIL